jgi:hypothetical protein
MDRHPAVLAVRLAVLAGLLAVLAVRLAVLAGLLAVLAVRLAVLAGLLAVLAVRLAVLAGLAGGIGGSPGGSGGDTWRYLAVRLAVLAGIPGGIWWYVWRCWRGYLPVGLPPLYPEVLEGPAGGLGVSAGSRRGLDTFPGLPV